MILKGADITNSQAIALALTLRMFPFISQIDFSNNRIKDEGAAALLQTMRFQLLSAYNSVDCTSCSNVILFDDKISLTKTCSSCRKRVMYCIVTVSVTYLTYLIYFSNETFDSTTTTSHKYIYIR